MLPNSQMMIMKFTATFLLLFSFCQTAQAYIDPGSGSFMLQMLIATLIGASLTIKMYFAQLKHKFKTLFKSKKPNPKETRD